MNSISRWCWAAVLGVCCVSQGPLNAAEVEPGFKPLFNGQDLSGWEGLPQFWSVKDGIIVGQTTKENPTKGNTFLVWKGGETADFELRLSYKLSRGSANSGVQYRSKLADPKLFVVGGYQADMEAGKSYSGILYEERGRGILAERGQKVVVKPQPNDPNKPRIEVIGTLGGSDAIQAKIKQEDWNEYVIIAKGNHLQHFINGVQTVDVTDEHTEKAAQSGILALQLHAGEPMTVQFRNIRMKTLSDQNSAQSDLDRVQGDWLAAEIIDAGARASADELASVKLKIQGNRFALTQGWDVHQGRFEVNSSAAPKTMDATLDDGDEIRAIYDLSNGQLKVCYAQPDSPRPAAFQSTPASETVLAVFQRKR